MATIVEKNISRVQRYAPLRLNAAKTVELRDAAPLANLERLISELIEISSAQGGYVALSVEEDVPLAFAGQVEMPLQLFAAEEENVFNDTASHSENRFCQPFRHNKQVVGYVLLNGIPEKTSYLEALIQSYAQLISKELELADKTAKLQYQNEKVLRKQKQLEQAIAFKNNILSLTTHDLRSPINAVNGYLELMMDSLIGEGNIEQLRDYHRQISKGMSNISDMIDQLNEIALIELQRIELNLIKVDLNWVVQEVCDVMQGPALSKNQTLQLNRSTKPLYVEIDIPKAKRIVFNLLSNAIKYTMHDGIVRVETSEYKGMANVSVRDSGIGIPREKLHTIFEPFQKLNNTGTHGEMSTGLGLFTCSYLTRLFRGSLTVESDIGKGSLFCLHLPLVKVGF